MLLAGAARNVRPVAHERHGQARVVDRVHAHREREEVRPLRIHVEAVDILNHAVDAFVHGLRALVAHEHVEGVGVDAAHALVPVEVRAQAVVHEAQHHVAALRTLDLVEQLELLQVQRHQGIGPQLGLVDNAAGSQVEPRLVEALRHRVHEREPLQLHVRLLQVLLRLHQVGYVRHGGVGQLAAVHVLVKERRDELHPFVAALHVQPGNALVPARVLLERLRHMLGDDAEVLGIVREVEVGSILEQRLVLVFGIADEVVVVAVGPYEGEVLVDLVLAHAQAESVRKDAVPFAYERRVGRTIRNVRHDRLLSFSPTERSDAARAPLIQRAILRLFQPGNQASRSVEDKADADERRRARNLKPAATSRRPPVSGNAARGSRKRATAIPA